MHMMTFEDLARSRLRQWLESHPTYTQANLGEAAGHLQGWANKFLAGTQGATLDELDAMARLFHHTIFELVDARPDPKEQKLLDAFRALPLEKRDFGIQVLEQMAPALARRGSRGRTGGTPPVAPATAPSTPTKRGNRTK